MATASYGGYDYSFVDKDLEKFTCNICTKVLRDPHLTGCCGQHFCESCLSYWFTKHLKESCPHCRAEGKEFQHLLDKSDKRQIDSLRIHCTNKEEGCQWIGELGSLKDHLELANGCGYAEFACLNNCRKLIKRKDRKNHLENECYLRPYQCEYCGHNDTYENITGLGGTKKEKYHYQQCLEFPLDCPNYKCGRKGIKRKTMKDHDQQCQEEWVECPYKCFSQKETWKQVNPLRSEKAYPRRRHFTSMATNKEQTSSSGYRHMEKHRAVRTKIKRKDVDTHSNECGHRPYECEWCGKKGTYSFITTKHGKKCPEFPLECLNKCGREDLKRKDMKDHRSQCPEEPVQCPFKKAGCKEKLVRCELEQHMSANQQQHQQMIKELKLTIFQLKNIFRVTSQNMRELVSIVKEYSVESCQKQAKLETELFLKEQEYKENERALKAIIKSTQKRIWKVIIVVLVSATLFVIIGTCMYVLNS